MNPIGCPRCRKEIDSSDNFCRYCGTSLSEGNGFIFSHGGIILLSLLLGPFALPVVWKSKLIGQPAKWIYTGVLFLIGVYLLVACWHIYRLMLDATQLLLGNGL